METTRKAESDLEKEKENAMAGVIRNMKVCLCDILRRTVVK